MREVSTTIEREYEIPREEFYRVFGIDPEDTPVSFVIYETRVVFRTEKRVTYG